MNARRKEGLRAVERQQHAPVARNDETIAHATKRELGWIPDAMSGSIAYSIADAITGAMRFPIHAIDETMSGSVMGSMVGPVMG